MNPIDKTSSAPLTGVRGPNEGNRPAVKSAGEKSGAVPFSELLGQIQQPKSATEGRATGLPPDLKFSAHAQTRMQSRGIELSPEEMMNLREAVSRASEKGSRESLILTDKAAFVVSVKNGTVITAVDKESLKENIFTNIDSTVMI